MENTNIEYKKTLNEHLEKVVVSFLNTDGGIVKIGVDDAGYIVGINNPDDIMSKISSRISNNIIPNPQGIITITPEVLNDKTIITVKVKKGLHPIYYIKKYGLSETGVYIRLGSTSLGMQQEEINKRYLESLNYKEPSITEIEASNQRLLFKDLKIIYQENEKNLNEETFKDNLKFFTKEHKFNILAEILSDTNQVSLKIITYAGIDKAEIIQTAEFGNKSLLVSAEQVLDYFEVMNRVLVSFEGAKRIEKPLINKRVLREAWINAIVHNDWSNNLSPIVHVFSNRIEIVSNGGLVDKMSKEEFFRGISKPRNLELMKIFLDIGLVEQTGYGVPKIISEYGRTAFEFFDNSIIVSLLFTDKTTNIIKQSKDFYLSETQKKILELIKENDNITQQEISVKLDLSIQAIKKSFRDLSDKGVIKRVGSYRLGTWEITDQKQ